MRSHGSARRALELRATVAPGAVVTFSGSDGGLFKNCRTGSVFYASASKTYTSAVAGTTTDVWAISTKPGLQTVAAAAVTTTATYTFYAAVASNAGRTLTVTPTKMSISRSEFKAIDVDVKDVDGNPDPRNSGITATLAGGGTLGSSILTTIRLARRASSTPHRSVTASHALISLVRWPTG